MIKAVLLMALVPLLSWSYLYSFTLTNNTRAVITVAIGDEISQEIIPQDRFIYTDQDSQGPVTVRTLSQGSHRSHTWTLTSGQNYALKEIGCSQSLELSTVLPEEPDSIKNIIKVSAFAYSTMGACLLLFYLLGGSCG